jgi:hypothetical protein
MTPNDPATVKHVVLLSAGDDRPTRLVRFVLELIPPRYYLSFFHHATAIASEAVHWLMIYPICTRDKRKIALSEEQSDMIRMPRLWLGEAAQVG